MNKANKYWYERINDEYKEKELKKSIWNFVKIILLIIGVTFICLFMFSCQSDEVENGKPQIYGSEKPPQEIKHDSIPAKFQGQWTEKNNNRIIVVIEADNLVMDLTEYGRGIVSLNVNEVNSINPGDQGMHIGNYTISKGTVGVYTELLTISVDGKKDCITRLKLYVPEVEQPQEPTEPETPTTPIG